jgi:hypothetical protein
VAARRIVDGLNRSFRSTLDRLGITGDPVARKAIARILRDLGDRPLPAPGDFEVLLPHGWVGAAWARPVPGRKLWVLFRLLATIIERSPHGDADHRRLRRSIGGNGRTHRKLVLAQKPNQLVALH